MVELVALLVVGPLAIAVAFWQGRVYERDRTPYAKQCPRRHVDDD